MQREFKISLSQEFYSDIVYLSQYDSDYPVIFTVTDKYSKASGINGYTAKFTGTRGDGTGLGFTYTATAIGHTVSFTIDTMLTGVAGTHTGEIIFYDQNDLYFGTANVQIIVEPAARPDGTIDADEEELRDLAQQCQDIVDTAAAEVKGEAEAWAVGERDGEPVPSTDPTYHNNAKYYAEQAQDIADSIGIDATLSVSGKAADAKKTGDEISSLKEDLSDIHSVTTVATNSTDINRVSYWINSSGVIQGSNSSIILPVLAGSVYTLTTTFNDGTNYALLKDTDFTIGNAPNYATGYTGRVMVAKNVIAKFTTPEDAKYIIIRADTDSMQNAITFKQYADLQSINRFNTCIEKQTSARNYEFFSIVPYVGMQAGSTNKIVSNTAMYLAYVDCEENRTYTVSKTADERFAVAWVKEKPSVGTSIYNYASNDTASSLQITTGDGAKYICVYYFASGISTLSENALFVSLSIADQGYTAIDRKARQKNDILGIKCIENGEFVLNKDNMLIGAGLALDPSTRKFITNAVMYTAYIPCEQNQMYIVEKIADTRFAVAWSKETPAVGVDIYGYYSDPTGTEISIYTGDGAKYLCIYYFASGVSTHTESELYASLSVTLDGYTAIDRIARQAKSETSAGVYIVSKDGKYSTINSALLVASDGDTILIMPGTYEEQIDAKNKNIHLIGYNKETCIILDKTGMYYTPPVEISGGSIQNLTIIETGENSTPSDPGTLPTLAYCIHADWDAMTDNSLLISNCILKCNKRATIGVGARNGFTLTVEYCEIWSGVQEDTGHDPRGAFYIHTYQYASNTTGTKLIMKNNRITCEDSVVMCLQDEGGVHVSCDLENNNLYSPVGGVSNSIVKGANNQDVAFSSTLIKQARCFGNNVSVLNN